MSWLKKLLIGEITPESLGSKISPELTEVQAALHNIEPDRVQYIGCVAFLAARLAGADSVISAGEQQRMTKVLQDQTHLSLDEAKAVIEIASAKELARDIEHQRITALTNEIATAEQKKDIIRALFHVACDADISEIESEKIRSISKALLMSNDLYISLRSEFSEYRSILK